MTLQYPSAAQAIRRQMARENLKPGMRLLATRALAEQLGFSPAAVARACNVLISAGVLRRKGYRMTVGSEAARPAALHGTIEVVSYFETFTRSVSRILTERGISYRVTQLSFRQHSHPAALLKRVAAARPSGVIFWTPELDEGSVSLLEATDIPFVICSGGARQSARWSSVRMDFFRATEKALDHLFALGHRHIAHVSYTDDDEGLENYHRMVCLKLNVRHSAPLIWKPEAQEVDVVRRAILSGLRRHPQVTAISCSSGVGHFAGTFLQLPQEISLVALGARPKSGENHPLLTTVELPDDDCIALWACTEIISQAQSRQQGLPAPPATQAMFVPCLMERGTTRALEARGSTREEKTHSASAAKPSPRDTWLKVYPSLKARRLHNWVQLDLSKLANHSLTRHHGWLGAEPLEYFPPGLRSIHGVPFRVLDEERNGGRAVITFRSIRSHSGQGKQLPTRVRVTVDSRVHALYFLHGCGSARPVAFANYTLRYKNGRSIVVPLIPLGISRRLAREALGSARPNLQDWWPAFEQVDFPHAHHAVVFNPADPAAYQRHIYSLEWINPQADEEVSLIEVRVDPKAGSTLALIAVTALLCA